LKSPRLENGYLKIVNELADAFCRFRLPGEAWQVAWVIIRLTYGFNRKEASISISDFEKQTGLKRASVVRAQKVLEKTKVGSKNATTRPATWRINKNYQDWVLVVKKLPGANPSSKNATLYKNNIKDKVLPPEAIRLSGLLSDLILSNNPKNRELSPGRKEKTIHRWAEDIDKMIRLEQRGPEEIERIIHWSQEDDFWKGNILSGGKLRKQFDQLVIQAERKNRQRKNSADRENQPEWMGAY